MIVDRGEIVDAERACQRLAAPSRACVHDRGGAAKVVQPADERAQPVFLAVDELDVVAQVRPDDARADDLGLPAECGGDLALGGRGCRGCHAEDRGPAERVESAADEEVVRPEVVAPHADAVHFVDHDEADVDAGDRVEEVPLPEPLRGDVEEPVAALGRCTQPGGRLVRVERRVDQRRLGRDLGRKLVDLVLHQRDQRREDERRRGAEHRSELVGERLPRPGRHQRERVSAVHGRADDLLLAGAEVREPEQACQCGLELAHPVHSTERVGTQPPRLRDGFSTRRRP